MNISTSLGSLGVSGSHAFFGFNEALNPKAGETLVVSSAAGNIGIVGNIFKNCFVILCFFDFKLYFFF